LNKSRHSITNIKRDHLCWRGKTIWSEIIHWEIIF
jgi:hypothetical protein